MGVTTISRENRSNFFFSDKQMTFNHDFRLFIFGAEVTNHIRGSISIVRNGRDAPGTMSFDLDNVNDIFTLTPRNKGYKVDDNGTYFPDENAKQIDIDNSVVDSVKKVAADLEEQLKKANEELESARNEYDPVKSDFDEKYEELQATPKKSKAAWNKVNKEATTLKKKLDEAELKVRNAEQKASSLKARKDALLGNLSIDEDGSYKLTGTFDSNANGKLNDDRTKKLKKKKDFLSDEIIKTLESEDLFSDGLYSDAAKQLIYTNKSIINADLIAGSNKLGIKFTKNFKPYPLAINSPIIEKNDPLRFFVRDPSCPFSEKGKWAPFFTGFIQNITEHTDYTTGEKYMTILCYDIRGLMQKQRVMTNPRISHGMDTAVELAQRSTGSVKNAGLFADYIAHTGTGGEKGSKYAFAKVDQCLLDLVTGRNKVDPKFEENIIGKILSTQSNEIVGGEPKKDADGAYIKDEELTTDLYDFKTVNNESKQGGVRPSLISMGCFMPGLELECPSYKNERDQHIKALELWYDLLVFGTKCDYFTEDEVTYVGGKTIPYGEFDPYNGWMHLLVPKGGTKAKDLFTTILDDLSSNFDFDSRFAVIQKVVEAVDYQWFCNAMGDIVVEFPMYDFVLDSFGAYADQLKIDNHLVDCQLNEIVDEIVTGMSVSGGVSHSSTEPEKEVDWIHTAFAKSDALAFKYGIFIEEYEIPTMKNSASRDNLKKQAVIELIKRNILASSMEMTVAYRWAIFPNKPVYNVDKNRMGTVSAFTYNIVVNESVSVSMDLRYIKKKLEDNTFIHIFNGDSMPIEYKEGNVIDTSELENYTTGIDVFDID